MRFPRRRKNRKANSRGLHSHCALARSLGFRQEVEVYEIFYFLLLFALGHFSDLFLTAYLLFVPYLWIVSSVEIGSVAVPWHLGWFGLALVLIGLRVGLRERLAGQGLFRVKAIPKSLGSVWFVFLFLVGIEQIFQWKGFEYKTASIQIRTTEAEAASKTDEPVPEGKVTRVHPELRWRFIPNVMWNGRKMNSLGFSDREFTREKAEGTFRVISLGDSCTAQSDWPYSRWLDKRLREEPPSTTHAWEAFNMGTHGYSLVQGAKLFELETADMAPDIVSVYFGWNDHWLSGGPTDRERLLNVVEPTLGGRVLATSHNLLAKTRFGQWLIKRRHDALRGEKTERSNTLRVPPIDFQNT